MSGHEVNRSDDGINPIDFGEPTPETRTVFDAVVERLKNLMPGVNYRGEDMLVHGKIIKQVSPLIQPNAIVEYSYNQYDDPLFGDYEPTYLSFRILGADDATLAALYGDIGNYHIVDLNYNDDDVEICYHKSLYDEMLHVDESKPAIIGSLDFDERLSAIINSVEGARETGADRPTEGTMKQLIAAIEQEVAKRLSA